MLEFCTLLDAKYLSQGLALYESINKYHKDYRLHVLALCPKSYDTIKRLDSSNVIIYSVADIETPELHNIHSKLKDCEYIWALKPNFIISVLDRAEHVAYVDADSYFFSTCNIDYVRENNKTPAAVTPHRFTPVHRCFAINGDFNAGFIYANRRGIPCLKDWGNRCIVDRKGIITDQVHLNVWPKQWGAHAIQHKGINLAPWNQVQYKYTMREGQIYVDEDPLVWYHFHQGLTPAYDLDNFVRQHIYGPYEEALCRAKSLL